MSLAAEARAADAIDRVNSAQRRMPSIAVAAAVSGRPGGRAYSMLPRTVWTR